MKKIFKYVMDGPTGRGRSIAMPAQAHILDFQLQDDVPVFWAEVDTEHQKVMRTFMIIGDGWEVPDKSIYIGTLQQNGFVWHLYEVL